MGEETSDADANAMNLDLNLGTDTEPLSGTVANEDIILDDWFDATFNRFKETRRRQRFEQTLRQRFLLASDHGDLHDRWPHPRDTISLELDELLENSGNGSVLQAGEGSVAAEGRAAEVPKACEIGNGGVALDETSEKKKEDVEKGGSSDVGFFDCNICFNMAKEGSCCDLLWSFSFVGHACINGCICNHALRDVLFAREKLMLRVLSQYMVVGMMSGFMRRRIPI